MPSTPKGRIPPLGGAIYDGPRVTLRPSAYTTLQGGTIRKPPPWERQVLHRGRWIPESDVKR